MNKKMLLLLVLVFVLVLAGAYVAYNTLGSRVAPAQQLLVQPTPEPAATEEPAEESVEVPAEEPAEESVEVPTEEPAEESVEAAHEPSGEDYTHAPDFTVLDRSGNEVQLSSRVGKPLVLNFWASWCGPCQMEMPDFQQKYTELESQVEFMMVNMTDGQQETTETATKFVDERGFSFPLYFDVSGEAAYNYGAYSLPMTFFIDAGGHVIAQATGAIDAETLQTGIDMIL